MTRKKLREGFTTGSAAAAAAKAALLSLAGKRPRKVEIPLPIGGRLSIAVRSIEKMMDGARATVIKDAGDDPDVTHKAVIGATVSLEKEGKGIAISGGRGVGKVTRQGLPVPIGESAINPIPLQQITEALLEGMAQARLTGGVRAVIDVENGEEIAKKTLNPRLGIMGGISILGTRGTVKPFSHDSYRETIRISMNVAREGGLQTISLSTGGKSEGFLRKLRPDLPEISFVQIADFFSFSLKEAADQGFREILYACFFGKLIKVAQGHPYTHAKNSRIDFGLLSEWCRMGNMGDRKLQGIRKANTARQALSILKADPGGKAVLKHIAEKGLQIARSFAGPLPDISIYLFDLDGSLLISSTTSSGVREVTNEALPPPPVLPHPTLPSPGGTGLGEGVRRKRSEMHPIHIVGVGISPEDLSGEKLRMISGADVLVCGERLLPRFKHFQGRRIVIKAPLEKVIQAAREEMLSGKLVVVAAEGDPAFFGIGRKLMRAFEREQVVLFPNVTTLQAAASRMKIPWEGIQTVSLHGRADPLPLFRALASGDRIGVFTDRGSNPSVLAGILIARGADGFRMWVFEDLGCKEEEIGCYELREAREHVFSPLNFVILERVRRPEVVPHLGMEDEQYLHGSGMITKKEVRAVGLAALQIEPHHTIWDLGAGCGSVGIEASLLAYKGAVYAVEQDDSRVEMILENRRRMGAYGVEVIRGIMPGCLEGLPEPDRIFMGGGLGAGLEVVETALSRLKANGLMVIHIVLLGSLEKVRTYLRSKGLDYSLTHVQVSRSQDLAGDERLEPLNPVYILTIIKSQRLPLEREGAPN